MDKPSTKNNEIRDYYNNLIEKAYNDLNKTVGTIKIQKIGKYDAISETKRFGRIPVDPEFIELPLV